MEPTKITREPIYKSSCGSCKRAGEDPEQKYICPKLEQHLSEYEKGTKERG